MTLRIDAQSQRTQQFLFAAAAFLLLYTSLRGLYYPHIWAATHSLFSYEFGLTKRSLIGSAYDLFGCSTCYSYSFFFYASNLLYIANLFLLWRITCRLIKTGNLAVQLLSIAFCASAGLVYLATTIGWGDHIGLFCVLVSLQIRHFYWRCGFILVTFSLAILIHEANYILFLPVAVASLIADLNTEKFAPQLTLVIIICVLLTLLSLAMAGAMLNPAELEQLTILMQEKADFPLHPEAHLVLSRDTDTSVTFMLRYLAAPSVQKSVLRSLVVSGPTVIVLMTCAAVLIRSKQSPILLRLLIPMAGLSPYFLYLFGWDLHRWNAMACITAFIAFYLVVELQDNPSKLRQYLPAPKVLPALAALLIAFNMLVSVPVLHTDSDKNPPFAAVIAFITDWPISDDDFPQAPINRSYRN